MKKISVLVLTLFALVSMFSCNLRGKEFGSGKVMALEFSTNPSTGYGWEYSFEGGDAEVVFDREETKLNENNALMGAPHNVVYYFRATKEGTKNLTFVYRQPWTGGEVAYDVVYELVVDKNLNIKCLSKMKGSVISDVDLSTFPNPVFTEE